MWHFTMTSYYSEITLRSEIAQQKPLRHLHNNNNNSIIINDLTTVSIRAKSPKDRGTTPRMEITWIRLIINAGKASYWNLDQAVDRENY